MKRLVLLLLPVILLFLTACSDRSEPHEPGVKYGGIGDAMSTEWFDFTVTDAYSCDRYQGHTPSEGYKLVVVTMSLKNDCGQPVDVWGEDFVLRWGDGDDALDIPLPAGLSDDQFPDEFVLGINETKSGVMAFEAPREFRDFSISFVEIFVSETNPDGEEGGTFFVKFTAEDR